MTSHAFNNAAKTRLSWLLICAMPLVPAVLGAVRFYIDSRLTRSQADWGDVIFAFVHWSVLGVFIPAIYLLARWYPVRKYRIGRVIGVHSIGALGNAALNSQCVTFNSQKLAMVPGPTQRAIEPFTSGCLRSFTTITGCSDPFTYSRARDPAT